MKRTDKEAPPLFNDDALAYWIQFVVGLVLVAWGAYFLGPWEAYQYTTTPTQSYQEEVIVGPLMALFQVGSGAACMYGAVRRSTFISNPALIGVVISYTIIVSLRIMVTGLFPLYWLFQLGLAFIAMLLMIRSGLKSHAD